MEKKHILIVEDAVKIAELLKDYLLKANFGVSVLDRGDLVVAAVKSCPPDLILLDIMLPGMDGISVCREIRSFSSVPIVMVSAKVQESDMLSGLDVGADDYICKPFSPRVVTARVKAVLRRAKPADKNMHCLISNSIRLDMDSRLVTVKGVEVHLTSSEFELLKILMDQPGHVFSRGDLVSRVQGYEYEGYDRTIDSHVKNLRKKIADHLPGKKIIRTIYGAGYTFDPTC